MESDGTTVQSADSEIDTVKLFFVILLTNMLTGRLSEMDRYV